MAAQLQYQGMSIGHKLGHPVSDYRNKTGDRIFYILELTFGVIFAVELAIKLVVVKPCKFLSSVANWFDVIIVAVWVLDLAAFIDIGLNPIFLRLARLARLLKLLRLIRTIRIFETFHLLIGSIKASVSVLFWSAMVLLLIQMGASMMLTQLLETVMRDPAYDESLRLSLWLQWGTFWRSMFTFFEITLGNWVTPSRMLMDKVNPWYGFVFVVYKLTVGFAILKVISAVFIQQTMKVATTDEEIMIMQKQSQSRSLEVELHRLFNQISSSGVLTAQQFREAVDMPRVQTIFAALEVNIADAVEVFDMLDTGNGQINWPEFLSGIKRIRGAAQSIDIVRMMLHQQRAVDRQDAVHQEALDLLQHMKYVTGSLATTLSPRNIPVPDTRVMSFPEKTSPLQTIPETNIPVPNSLVPNTAVRNSPDMAAANSGASDADYADHADKDEGTSFIPEERRGCPL